MPKETDPSAAKDVQDLFARLRFKPEDGEIRLDGDRMVLIHLTAFATLRRELIDQFGMDKARGILTRMGYVSGASDAQFAQADNPDAYSWDSFQAGPLLHAMEGMVVVDTITAEVDPEKGTLAGEWYWKNSAEADAHLDAFGISNEPVCWTLMGYAQGFHSGFVDEPTIFREVECRAMGAPQCRVVGKPATLWAEDEGDKIRLAPGSVPETDASWTALLANIPMQAERSEDELIGVSPAFVAMMHLVDRVARTKAPALLIGEGGSGRHTLAQTIHRYGSRANKPFLAVNCAARTGENLLTHLFGVEKTAAGAAHAGRIERASGGTIFFEDVHRLDLATQARLMQVLRHGEVERIGGTNARKVDVRIIAAADNSLLEAMRAGLFREDLYHRLAMFPIIIPPLRDRRADLPLLIRRFVDRSATAHGKRLTGLTAEARAYLSAYDYPGNIAELQSMIERAVIMTPNDGPLGSTYFPSPIEDRTPRYYGLSSRGLLISRSEKDGSRHDSSALDRLLESAFDLEQFELELIGRAVKRADGNLSQAAKLLGLTRPQLAYRYKKSEA